MALTQEFLRAHFDYVDGHLYWKCLPNKKGPRKVGDIAGGLHPIGYWTIGVNGTKYYAHRLIWAYHHGTEPVMIDHINKNRSDNRIENLRPCVRSENMMNQVLSARNTSGVKGVSWSSQNKKWRAHIGCQGKLWHIGYFSDIEDAKAAVAAKRIELHGEFASH